MKNIYRNDDTTVKLLKIERFIYFKVSQVLSN